MKSSLNFKHFLALPLLLAVSASFAQNEIQGTQTDETYGNTTIVYTKDKSTNDAAILAQLDNSYGIGDVVRITVAQPKPAASDMLASDDPGVMFAAQSTPTVTPKVVRTAPKSMATTARKPVAATVETPKKTVEPAANKISRTIRMGSIFRLERVYFDANQSELKADSEEELANLLEFMEAHPTAVIEVRGHTNNLMWPNAEFANELSTSRAKVVAEWLIAKGVAAERVQHKGYGWTMPILPNINAEGRKKNQRVEVKVINM